MFGVYLLLIVVIHVITHQGAAHQCRVQVNGCSIPGNLPFLYKKKFTPACNKHDVCYSCGQYYHWSRQSCDISFQNDMYHLCTLPRNKGFVFEILNGAKKVLKTKEEAHCRTIAYLYYKAVDLLGRDRYNYISPGWCQDPCVEKIGSPNRRIGYSENN
ncbi:uncharacterized protein LOC116296404 [Actinia tenebrosa]|uniref:Uncharacterized protein LOC116296404 n=1 Tax=Actinia tenebrosa TaxID=6105 RepID=A0A6P8HY36_ACTTE|nr:uncharacterized protein LOC116296404 [Actinia tenebrosa]